MQVLTTNIRQVLEAMEDDPQSAIDLLAGMAGRALALLETVYLYAPDGRRLMVEILGTELEVGSMDLLEARGRDGFSVKVTEANGDAA